jgi:hypothetical protein
MNELIDNMPELFANLVANSERIIVMTFLPPRALSQWLSTLEKFKVQQVVKWNSIKSGQLFLIDLSRIFCFSFFVRVVSHSLDQITEILLKLEIIANEYLGQLRTVKLIIDDSLSFYNVSPIYSRYAFITFSHSEV